jgi:hypothetical protein
MFIVQFLGSIVLILGISLLGVSIVGIIVSVSIPRAVIPDD